MAKINTSLENLISLKDETADGAELDLIEDFDQIEQSIYSAINREVVKMDQEDGSILFTDRNLLILFGLSDIILNAIQKSKYPRNVNRYISNFDDIKNYNLRIQQKANDFSVGELEDLISPLQQQIVAQVVNDLTGQGVNVAFIKPLTEGLYKNIVSGSTVQQMQDFLKAFIESDEKRLGQFKKYVTQISRDAIYQFDGQLNARIAAEYKLDAFRYVGGLVRDSRPQCILWYNKGILLKKDLEAEIAKAYSSGSGMIPGTTPDNFIIYRGGYNCRHTAIPIRLTKEQKNEFGIK